MVELRVRPIDIVGEGDSIASSKPYRFIIGPQRRKFTIHSAIVARQSDYLDKLVNGDFKEGNEKTVHWENVDEETFVCFWQYAYRGSYDIPGEEPKTTQSVPEEGAEDGNEMESSGYASENPDEAVEDWPHEEGRDESAWPEDSLTNYAAEERPKEPSNRGQLWELFTTLRSTGGNEVEVEPEQGNEGCDVDAGDLLCHARIYVFADCYGIFDLMDLSYNSIHRILCNLDLRTETLADIIALVHYCYETPAPPDLKELVVLYSACNIELLWVDEQFQHIIETHGDLSRAVIASLLGRLTR
ncbi:hypothetical protein H634G_07780 [Metarhizium anisopliae BRIP 53293]|uniref:BTB domain-containing protein n=1 Tax=Metarhizium anisopliae BRIP 53293 TaxID=1291518 RepID=A0A0D9NRW7_METAN|nr:hypothetical protein H634G_07780 [Metarhizium anisopliae BRIP 53293]KJK89304.1 hypothetical protein H633G_06839 [Metarhizium anisopliae BRIP 53284]